MHYLLVRVFVAGASGVIGRPLVPRLVERHDTVAGMTRSQPEAVRELGEEFAPDVVINVLTDLPTGTRTSSPARRRASVARGAAT